MKNDENNVIRLKTPEQILKKHGWYVRTYDDRYVIEDAYARLIVRPCFSKGEAIERGMKRLRVMMKKGLA